MAWETLGLLPKAMIRRALRILSGGKNIPTVMNDAHLLDNFSWHVLGTGTIAPNEFFILLLFLVFSFSYLSKSLSRLLYGQ